MKKERIQEKMFHLRRTLKHKEIETFVLHLNRERAEMAIFQNDQTHKNREVERGRRLEPVSSTPCPPI